MANLHVGPYEFLRPLGAGGQGSVWLAADTRSGAQVAIKVLPPGNWGTVELARLRRESKLLLTFSDPGLPTGLGVVEDASQRVYGFVMQLVQGTSLHQALQERAPSPPEAAAVATELARIVAVLHSRGVVHRDLKLANVLVRPGWDTGRPGSIVIVDLGIARGLDSSAATAYTGPGGLVGSAPYVAPELLSSTGESGPTTAVDVFSLGVMIWIVLFRKHPTGLSMSADFQDFLQVYRSGAFAIPDPSRAAEVRAAVPGFLPVLYRCLEFNVQQRFPSAHDLHQALLNMEGAPAPLPVAPTVDMPALQPAVTPTLDMNAVPIPVDPRAVDWKSRIIILVGFVVVAAATVAGVLWVWR